jgi:hypothetical protein
MKIGPIAIWASEILRNPSEANTKMFRKIINADSTIIHSEELTGFCIFVYSATIAFLINNRTDKDRAGKALNYAKELAGRAEYANISADGGDASASKWIQ